MWSFVVVSGCVITPVAAIDLLILGIAPGPRALNSATAEAEDRILARHSGTRDCGGDVGQRPHQAAAYLEHVISVVRRCKALTTVT